MQKIHFIKGNESAILNSTPDSAGSIAFAKDTKKIFVDHGSEEGWQVYGGAIQDILYVTYNELKTLVETSTLKPKSYYQLTDYEFLPISSSGNVKSANHNFDLIIYALSESQLSEACIATPHEGDTYFSNNDLSAWKIKYSLNKTIINTISTTKGQIYYMQDEFNNIADFDFKNFVIDIETYLKGNSTLNTTVNKYWDTSIGANLESKFYYTFSYIQDGKIIDASLTPHCFNNTVSKLDRGSAFSLSNDCLVSNTYNSEMSFNVLNGTSQTAVLAEKGIYNNRWEASHNMVIFGGSNVSFNDFWYINTTSINSTLDITVNNLRYLNTVDFKNTCSLNDGSYITSTFFDASVRNTFHGINNCTVGNIFGCEFRNIVSSTIGTSSQSLYSTLTYVTSSVIPTMNMCNLANVINSTFSNAKLTSVKGHFISSVTCDASNLTLQNLTLDHIGGINISVDPSVTQTLTFRYGEISRVFNVKVILVTSTSSTTSIYDVTLDTSLTGTTSNITNVTISDLSKRCERKFIKTVDGEIMEIHSDEPNIMFWTDV